MTSSALAGGFIPVETAALRKVDGAGLLQILAVVVLAFSLYASLRSELPVDDVLRFTPNIAAGIYEWESSHLLMQPAALLWHRHLSFGASARTSQERFNGFCAALSLGILYLLLLRLGVSPLRRVLLIALGALAFNVLLLATSGHIKLAVLPFVTLSLYHGILWEREVQAGVGRRDVRLAASAILLGVSTAFLISNIVVAPFLGLAAGLVSLRTGSGPRRALLRVLLVGALAGAVGLGLLVAGYILAVPGPATAGGFYAFLFHKANRWAESGGPVESLARGLFGVVQNFVYVGDFGAMARTWMSGDSTFLGGGERTHFLVTGLLFAAALALLGWIFGESLLRLFRGRGPAIAWAFLLGTVAFAIPWNLNEADFYFEITFPTVALLALAPTAGARVRRAALEGALAALVAGTVLLGWAIPRRDYPLHRYNAELRARLTSRDLVVSWSFWSGGPSIGFMDLPGVPQLYPDHYFYRNADSKVAFRKLAADLDRRLAAGGRIYLFDLFDGKTWNAPWPRLRRRGVTPRQFERFLHERYTVVDHGEIAEMRCWELLPRAASLHGTPAYIPADQGRKNPALSGGEVVYGQESKASTSRTGAGTRPAGLK